ncbi:hypothetical protein [Nocardioides mangrovicus]|uniref:hypothetical protein n=1 Tax=Nocardioides mangrovicus TaxID=2478913 RepID=UPI0011C3DC70|nr:hypothetical protein [Nocardioides mangrovicus]
MSLLRSAAWWIRWRMACLPALATFLVLDATHRPLWLSLGACVVAACLVQIAGRRRYRRKLARSQVAYRSGAGGA